MAIRRSRTPSVSTADPSDRQHDQHGGDNERRPLTGWSLAGVKATGLMTSFPALVRPPPANSSGAWTLTSCDFSGTCSVRLQFGHGPDLPGELVADLETLPTSGTDDNDRHAETRGRAA